MCRQLFCLLAIASITAPANAAPRGLPNGESAALKAVFVSLSEDVAAKISGNIESRCRAVKFVQTEMASPNAKHSTSGATGRDW